MDYPKRQPPKRSAARPAGTTRDTSNTPPLTGGARTPKAGKTPVPPSHSLHYRIVDQICAHTRILETVRAAAGERLVVLDGVIEPGNAPDGAKWLDLLMLVIAGGRERTAEQWRVLLGDAGGRATRVGEGVIEAQPA